MPNTLVAWKHSRVKHACTHTHMPLLPLTPLCLCSQRNLELVHMGKRVQRGGNNNTGEGVKGKKARTISHDAGGKFSQISLTQPHIVYRISSSASLRRKVGKRARACASKAARWSPLKKRRHSHPIVNQKKNLVCKRLTQMRHYKA